MSTAKGACVALMTVPDVEVGERLVRTLVEEGVVACGNIVPGLTSIYRWKGAVERDAEALVILKLVEEAVPRLLTRAPELHPYEVPEVLVLPVIAGHDPYLDWLAESTTSVRDRD